MERIITDTEPYQRFNYKERLVRHNKHKNTKPDRKREIE